MGSSDATQLMHLLPALPYPVAALEPHIDARTMALHHGKHHASYVANLNALLAKLPQLATQTALWMLHNPDEIPADARAAVLNNAGGHVNHSMLWRAMSPNGGGEPRGALAEAIRRDFGGLEQLKIQFAEAGAKQFASGWVWLASSTPQGGALQVMTTSGHDNPVASGLHPVLVNDVWEHAYYLKYQNRRGDYLKNWWSIVSWPEAARRFEGAA
jgi:superoxide dismutase, Fe-Mn family